MIKLIKVIPNMLTLIRVVLALILNIYIINNFRSMIVPIVVSLIIFLTDYLDGKIARRNRSVSKAGAILDVSADLFYIAFSYIVLYTLHILPIWFLSIVILKFGEFILTSHYIKRLKKKNTIFVFDFLGRLAVVIFYCLPLTSYVAYQLLPNEYFFIISSIMAISTLLVFISSTQRIGICVNGYKALNNKAFVSEA